jgi:rhodanese-related sulfurtransferase
VLHGELYEYNRDHHLATNDLSNVQLGIPKPNSSFNYPGGNAGGPVVIPGWNYSKSRDRLFFFAGLEVQRQQLDQGAHLSVVPTLLQREGLFTESVDPIGDNLGQASGPVLIPRGFAGAGTPAPGADLRPYLSPLGQVLASLYPLPTGSYQDNRYNYAVNIPLPQLRARLGELPRDREILVICRSGQRAYYATRILLQNGFKARNLSGGMLSRSVLLGK